MHKNVTVSKMYNPFLFSCRLLTFLLTAFLVHN
jgi:hypothetical protein